VKGSVPCAVSTQFGTSSSSASGSNPSSPLDSSASSGIPLPPGTHPQVLLVGRHSHVRNWFQSPDGSGRYLEWIVATPFLEWSRARGGSPA
jgi:hypothetical protein